MRLLVVYSAMLLLIGCSSTKEAYVQYDQDSEALELNESDQKQRALEAFINGATSEAKGDYANAVLEFQDALRLDPKPGIYYALAKNYFYLNKLALSLQNIKKAVDGDSSNYEYYHLMVDIYFTARQNDSAAAVLDKLIGRDSSHVHAYYRLARIYENAKPLKAIEIYNKLTKIIGPEWSVLIRVAELYEMLGDNKNAISTIKTLLEIDPSNVALQKLLSEYFTRDKQYDSAMAIINDILEFTPDDMDAREKKAKIFIDKNDWKSAAAEYSIILNQKNIPLDTKIRIGTSYFIQSLKDTSLTPAVKNLFSTIDKDTTDWQVKMYLGAIALNEKDDSNAIKNFEAVTKLASWNVDAWIRLGGIYFDNQRYKEAAKVMEEAIEIFPQDFAVNLILGLSLAQLDRHSDAIDFLQKAVELNSNDVNALSAYAYSLNQLKDFPQAINYLNKALLLEPANINLLGTLGLIYDSQKKWNECDSVYEKALALDSLNLLINNNFAYSLSERGIQLNRALRMAETAVAGDPNNSSFLDTIGWVYFKLGNYSKAKEFILRALEAGGEKAVIVEHLGDVLFKMGDKTNAKQKWERAFELNSDNSELKQKLEKGEI